MTGAQQHGGKVIVVGAINVDLVINSDRLPGPGETVVGWRVDRHGGGKGANAAVAAARAGADVRLVGAVGLDNDGQQALDELRAEGVDVSGVAQLAGESSGIALIVVDPHGENQIAVGAGANAALDPDRVGATVANSATAADCLLVSTEIPPAAVASAIRAAAACGAQIMLNPAPPGRELVELFDYGPVLTPNGGECVELAGLLGFDPTDVLQAATLLARRTGSAVVVTLGSGGVMVVHPSGEPLHIPSRPTSVRDTTGAGDTFNGILATWLAAKEPLDMGAHIANVGASLSVAHMGARAGMPRAAAIHAAV